MKMNAFKSSLSKLLCDVPRGTSADLGDSIAAYWNGHEVAYCHLCKDGSGRVAEEFDLDEKIWAQLKPDIDAWIKRPVFSMRPWKRT
jgi:hypothetical protein